MLKNVLSIGYKFIKHQISLLHNETTNSKKVAVIFEILKFPSIVLSFLISYKLYTNLININLFNALINSEGIIEYYISATLLYFSIIIKVLTMLLLPSIIAIIINANSEY